jgi:hypothetical protein
MLCSGRALGASTRAASALGLALALALAPPAARPAAADTASTGAFHVTAPTGGWKRSANLDPPGRLTWTVDDPTATTAVLRVEFVGVRARTADAAVSEILGREKAEITSRAERDPAITRGDFEPDSMSAHGLAWSGFRVHVKTGDKEGDVRRWVALHPDFAHRRRAYVVSLDEQTLAKARPVPRGAAAAALARSLEPAGVGLAGGLVDAYLDARVSTFAARIDTTTRLCWQHQDEDVAHAFLGVARGLAGDGDFFQSTQSIPPDSVVDPASPDYGVGFDRNGDGKIDLLVLNRGIVAARGAVVIPVVVVLADDDFDGRIDGSILENADADGDGRADHRLCVLDTNHDGRPDRAVRFTDDLSDHANRSLSIKDGVVEDTLVGSKVGRLDFAESWRDGDRLLARWNRVRAACGP